MMSRITLSLKKAGRRGDIIASPFLFGSRNPDFFSDTFLQSAADSPDDVPPPDAGALKQPDRLILHGRNPIQFAVPPSPFLSPQPSQMTDPFAFSDHKACLPLRGSVTNV
jgi:hypothetical protein